MDSYKSSVTVVFTVNLAPAQAEIFMEYILSKNEPMEPFVTDFYVVETCEIE